MKVCVCVCVEYEMLGILDTEICLYSRNMYNKQRILIVADNDPLIRACVGNMYS